MNAARRAAALFVIVLVTVLAILFHRSLLYGEIFSPADLLYTAYPWAYDGPRIPPSNIVRSDEALFHQPLFATHWARLRGGDFPEWDPTVLSGEPAFFDGISLGQAFSPLSLPFYFLPADVAVTLYAPLRLFCAALLMWIFAGTLGLSPVARAGAALAFALNGVFLVWLSAPLTTIGLFLPLTCLLAERAARLGRARDAAALALALGAQFMGAYLPPSFVVTMVTAAYGLCALLVHRQVRGLVALTAGGVAGTVIGAVALVPMFLSLAGTEVAARAWSARRPPLANLATFALPDFWGNPARLTWWYPGDGNYAEFVAYAGVASVVLAGAGFAVRALQLRDWRAWFFAGVAAFVVCYTYGVPPIGWLGHLPVMQSMNSLRWNLALPFAVAALCGCGLDAIVRPDALQSRRWWVPIAGGLAAAAVLAAGAAVGLDAMMPAIRQRGLQAAEKALIVRYAALAACVLALVAVGAWLARRPASPGVRLLPAVCGMLAVAVVVVDLLHFGWRFNPTIPKARYYPDTPGLRVLRDLVPHRIAPLGDHRHFPQSHVWSMYGLSSVTGFDFRSDADYQEFLTRAAGRPWTGARFGYLDLPVTSSLDLRLLGLLGVDALMTAPVDAATDRGGYEPVGELTDGRILRQTFRAGANGLRRVDLLTATFDRANAGTLAVAVSDEATGQVLASRTVDAATVPNNDWLPLDVPEQTASLGRLYIIEVRAEGAAAGRAATIWASQDGYADGHLALDGRPTPLDLWFRTFATARDRWPQASLVFSRDVNLYRNHAARPRAWFVSRTVTAPKREHLDRLAAAGFDPATTALIEHDLRRPAQDGAQVLETTVLSGDEQRVSIAAPDGGLLVFSERFHPGWRAVADGRQVDIMRANHLLLAVPVAPGTKTVTLQFEMPWLRKTWLVSGLTAVAALGVLLARRRPAAS